MDNLNEIVAQLQNVWAGQTLGTLRKEASKEFNGTQLKTLRSSAGPRYVLLICITGQYELSKFRDPYDRPTRVIFDNWESTGLFEALTRAIMTGGVCYDELRKDSKRVALLFVITGPEMVAQFEGMFGGLTPEKDIP